MSDASAKSSKKVNSVVNDEKVRSEKMEYMVLCGGFNVNKGEKTLEVVSSAEMGNIIPAFSNVGTYTRENGVIKLKDKEIRENDLRTVSMRISFNTKNKQYEK